MLCKSWRRKWIRGVNETYPIEIRPLACYQQAWKVVTTTFPITLFVLPYAAIRAAIVGIAAAAEEEARSWSRRVVPSRGRNSWTKPRFSARLAAPGNNRSIIINHRFETRLYIHLLGQNIIIANKRNHKDDPISFFGYFNRTSTSSSSSFCSREREKRDSKWTEMKLLRFEKDREGEEYGV